jgi:CRISPR-associated protein Cas1
MPVGYVTEPGATICLRGQTVEIVRNGERLAKWQLSQLDSICIWGGVNFTQPAVRALLKTGVTVAMLNRRNQLLGRLVPLKARNVALRYEQYRCYADNPRRLFLARALCDAKIANARSVLLRFARNHPGADLGRAAASLNDLRPRIRQAESLETVLGLEGTAARCYFSVFGQMCRADLEFNGRSIRPPRDPVNALLSLGYTLLVNELMALTDAIGLDPYMGFYHALDYGRPSLALDLAEPFRTGLIDRLVLFLVNNRVFRPEDFEQRGGGCYLSRRGFQGFVRQYERLMLRRTRDRHSGRRETLRRQLQLQVERFAGTLQRRESPNWFTAPG